MRSNMEENREIEEYKKKEEYKRLDRRLIYQGAITKYYVDTIELPNGKTTGMGYMI